MDRDDVFARIRRESGEGVSNLFAEFGSFVDGVTAHYEFQKRLMRDAGPLSREEREWIMMEVSLVNECPYSFRHASQALELLRRERGDSTPSRRQELLSLLAIHVSRDPRKASPLRAEFAEAGFSEAEWQHSVMVAAYANFANRLAETMDLPLEPGFGGDN